MRFVCLLRRSGTMKVLAVCVVSPPSVVSISDVWEVIGIYRYLNNINIRYHEDVHHLTIILTCARGMVLPGAITDLGLS